jgi:pyruvate dehydrogenase (quinone)
VEIPTVAGVQRLYGIVGDSLKPIVDAIRRKRGIDSFHVHNEEAGAFAASAEAQLTGRLAVCAGSSGPGNTHLVQGLYDAHRSGAPSRPRLASAVQPDRHQLLPRDPAGARP